MVEAYNTSAFAATCVTLPLPRGSPAGEVALLERFFRGVVARRVLVVVAYALLIPPAVLLALRVGSDNSIDRLIVPSDPDYRQTRDFQDVFPEGQHVILLADAKDPFAPEVLRRVAALERALASIPEVRSFSAVTLYERARPSFEATPEQAAEFKAFVSGSTLFRKQGLVGDDFLGIPIEILASSPAERDRILAKIDAAAARAAPPGGALEAIRKVGRPYVDAYLEHETKGASLRYFPLFALFVVGLNITLYRSRRALAAFLVVLALNVLFALAFAGITGYAFTIVSSLVPLTVLITCTATLVYIHSRYVDAPEGVDPDEHQIFSLVNKFLPCTASIFAAAVGFAALAVSGIRPIREMGIWTAAGIGMTWVMVFTLFPALQRLFRTPTRHGRRVAGRWFPALVARIPGFSYRWRWVLVPGSLALCVFGTVALFGIPRWIEPMRLETEALDYIDRDLPLYKDTRRFERAIGGLTVTSVWIKAPDGGVVDPEVLRGIERFTAALEADERVGSVSGPTSLLRWMRYIGGSGDALPDDPGSWTKLASDLEQLLLQEPALREYVDVASLSQARLRVVSRSGSFEGHRALVGMIEERWAQTAERDPALAGCSIRVVGQGLLQSKIAHYLVPTLAESFLLTAGVIFVTFLIVFRNGAARVMAMIPSLFAILVMFLIMRALSIPLNVATILIASTVLGASENDQIHFFYHFQERRKNGTTEQALLHTLLISGRAIWFATLINAGGFMALAFSSLPPMRQFGIISASAFLLSMLADFTALPAALWIFFREKPDAPRG